MLGTPLPHNITAPSVKTATPAHGLGTSSRSTWKDLPLSRDKYASPTSSSTQMTEASPDTALAAHFRLLSTSAGVHRPPESLLTQTHPGFSMMTWHGGVDEV